MKEQSAFAVSSYALFDLPLREAVARLMDAGWTSIEIMCEAGHAELLAWSREQLAELKKQGEERGITWSIHAPISGCNLAAGTGPSREKTLETMKRCLAIARFLDSTHVVMHAGEVADAHDADSRARGVEHVSEAARLLTAEVSDGRTTLALENVPPYPRVLGWNVDDLLAVCKAVDSAHLGIAYDVGHAHLIRPGYALEALETVFPYVSVLHISDNGGETDEHLAVGEGTIPYAQVWSALQAGSFAGSRVIETKQLACARRSVERIIAQL
ncbi:AP endonuclease [Brevibacillus agri]|uniref:AP endonuclease n=1 Tax=Brevibacillus agri TaxID=51101 RepID=A0A3M8AUF6_9BACL|nr:MULTISPECIES: sugar phosphate isomerase/epimerase family protein [Brevibacillus]MBY0053419.1 sugar phosphate isomerase/epimerase [Brevibacillus agri]MED3498743.1 sugar phosphate isomerase/epimerase [Brevibacillus agri]QAV11940.1 sugar phosphate isomerase/epimerase [Brevibacillus agri]QHZ54392.1 sugar phosphate isomerase/epimerase [Brevibacillus sp. NSP2.1]RNB54225.1 sugar phosphate isomerase/epimerase [Brevibacillus agri]